MEANPHYKQDLKKHMGTEAKEKGQFSSAIEYITLIFLNRYLK